MNQSTSGTGDEFLRTNNICAVRDIIESRLMFPGSSMFENIEMVYSIKVIVPEENQRMVICTK